MSTPLIVGLGEILWDLLPGGKQLGGAVANFAYHAQALGGWGVVASCVGEDALGREILRRLLAVGMDTRYIAIDAAHPTGTVEVRVEAQGVPTYIIHTGVAWDFIPATAQLLDLARQADAVCFGSLAQRSEGSRQTIRRFLAATRPECLRIFDINLRQHYYSAEIIDDSLRQSGVLKLNNDELPVLGRLLGLDGAEGDAVAELFRRYLLRAVALTCGSGGSRLYAGGKVFTHAGYPTTVVDTVGAGDAFTAALAVGLLRGDDPAAINDRANRLASYVCSQAGAMPPIKLGL